MVKAKAKRLARQRRHARVRKRVYGTAARPRLCVFRSLKHIHAQIIDDVQGHTLTAASTLDAEVRARLNDEDKTAQAAVVGETLAQRALAAGIEQVVFDRGGYRYHGRVKALAEAAREGGEAGVEQHHRNDSQRPQAVDLPAIDHCSIRLAPPSQHAWRFVEFRACRRSRRKTWLTPRSARRKRARRRALREPSVPFNSVSSVNGSYWKFNKLAVYYLKLHEDQSVDF